jgi:uncharacterized protein YecE (DUF72 family)
MRPHKLDYDAQGLQAWAERVKQLNCSDTFVYFKHDEGVGSGPQAVAGFVLACSTS